MIIKSNPLSGLKLRSKLILLTSAFIVSLLCLSACVNVVFKSSKTLAVMLNLERIYAEKFEMGVSNYYRYVLNNDTSYLESSKNQFEQMNKMAFTFAHVDSIINNMPQTEWADMFVSVFGEGINNDKKLASIVGKQTALFIRLNNKKIKAIIENANDTYNTGERIIALLNNKNLSVEKQQTLLQSEFDNTIKLTKEFGSDTFGLSKTISQILSFLMFISVLVLGLLSFLISARISNSIALPVKKLANNFKDMARGNLNTKIEINQKNEIGELSGAFSQLQSNLSDIILYSKNISNGNYDHKLAPNSDDDDLTKALNKMADKLEKNSRKVEIEKWIQKGVNLLDANMRGNLTVRELSKNIITFLSNFLEFENGAVYVFDEVNDYLELTGSIGLNVSELKKTIKTNEGLIGKAAQAGELQIIDAVEKYHKIYSATGEIMPEKVYLLPLNFEDNIQSVIEISAIKELSEDKIAFLKTVSDRIAVNLNAAVARFRINELLETTLDQSEALKKREEELSEKLAENQAMHNKLIFEKAILDSMLRTLPDFIYFKDLESKFLNVSNSMIGLFGAKSPSEIIGKTDFDFHKPEDAKTYFDEEQKMIKTGKGFVDVIRKGIDENKNELWTSVTKLPMYDETGKCIGTFGITKNITEIKQLEIDVNLKNEKLLENEKILSANIEKLEKIQAELEREKALMDSLLNTLPDTVYFKDTESRFVKVSQSMAKLFNVEKPEELYGKTDFDFFDKEHASQAYDDEQRIIKTKKPIVGYVEKEVLSDGSIRYVSSTKMPYFNEKGEVMGTFGISRDITKIKELELEINKRNKELEEQQKQLTIANNELNLQQEELKTANEELKSQEEELRVANEELAEQTKVLQESEKSLQVQQEELRVTNEELEIKTRELEEQQKEIRKKNKELEEKAKELEQASKYKSEFLANMSHELRTPLNSMLILSKLLGNNKKGNLTEEQIKSAQVIHKSGNDLLELINEILDLSKIEAGKMTFDFSTVSMNDIKTEILQNFKPVAENKNLSFEIIESDDFPKTLYSDKQRLMQIIKNLLSNAFKFTKNGGITIEMGRNKKGEQFSNPALNQSNTCYISVADTGVGIPKNKMGAIFEAFQQADGSISRNFGGTGLGLSISKELIYVLGGEIHVESNEGKGSTFTLFLPLDKSLVNPDDEYDENPKANQEVNNDDKKFIAAEKATETVNANEPEEPFFIADDRDSESTRKPVLIIHSEKENAKQLLHQCHERNFNAVVANSIQNGIILARKYNPTAIILAANLNHPVEFEKLKADKATSSLPIHYLSRIEDESIDGLEDLVTPASQPSETPVNILESKLNTEFKEILIVEDNNETLQALHLLFNNKDIIIHEATSGQEAYEIISAKVFDCVILDLGLPDYSGLELLNKLNQNNIKIPNIIIHTAKDLSKSEIRELRKYSESIVIKGIKSDERLMEEVSLFLHEVENKIPKEELGSKTEITDNSFGGKKILVVDDDIRNVFALVQILEEKGMKVMEAENGKVAIDALKNTPDIDLVLMDIMMPEMDGYEAMKIIRETPEISSVPIITLTAKAMKEDYQKAIDSGANDYISKPLDTDKLFELLKIWLFK